MSLDRAISSYLKVEASILMRKEGGAVKAIPHFPKIEPAQSKSAGCGPSTTARRLIASGIILGSLIVVTACRQDMHDQPKYIPLRPVDRVGTVSDGRSARPLV